MKILRGFVIYKRLIIKPIVKRFFLLKKVKIWSTATSRTLSGLRGHFIIQFLSFFYNLLYFYSLKL
jgi:hypothetical protein